VRMLEWHQPPQGVPDILRDRAHLFGYALRRCMVTSRHGLFYQNFMLGSIIQNPETVWRGLEGGPRR
jgi:hypothetical protein